MKACRGAGELLARGFPRLKAKTRRALSGAAERFTSESLNRDRALLTPSACTVYSSSAGKNQQHQAVLAERHTEARMFLCVKAFFLLLAHLERMSLSEQFRNGYILPGLTGRFVLEMRNNRVCIQYWHIIVSFGIVSSCLQKKQEYLNPVIICGTS